MHSSFHGFNRIQDLAFAWCLHEKPGYSSPCLRDSNSICKCLLNDLNVNVNVNVWSSVCSCVFISHHLSLYVLWQQWMFRNMNRVHKRCVRTKTCTHFLHITSINTECVLTLTSDQRTHVFLKWSAADVMRWRWNMRLVKHYLGW